MLNPEDSMKMEIKKNYLYLFRHQERSMECPTEVLHSTTGNPTRKVNNEMEIGAKITKCS